jgi:hypothetical protein
MTGREINEAIAEWFGVYMEDHVYVWAYGGVDWTSWELPSFCDDLTVIHQAEQLLDYEQGMLFEEELCSIVKKENEEREYPYYWRFAVCHATARQRAEALLKTLGKWRHTESNNEENKDNTTNI